MSPQKVQQHTLEKSYMANLGGIQDIMGIGIFLYIKKVISNTISCVSAGDGLALDQ